MKISPFRSSQLAFSLLLALSACSDSTSFPTAGESSTGGGSTGGGSSSTDPTTTTPTTTDPTSTGTGTTTSTTDPGTSSTDPGTSTTTDPGTSSTTDTTDTTEGTSSTTDTTDGSTGSSTGDPPPCMPGELLCPCLPGDVCNEGVCLLGDCAPYTGQCESEFDLFCDEGITCAPGTDPFDCCSTWQNNVCEENGMGGSCPKGSDYWDCGYCPFENDGICDEGFDCPNGTDPDDCCAIPENGVCDEISQGGMCPDGSDPWDCGDCPYTNDGFCDEPNLCPPGSDKDDCCAIPENGVCEEIGQGGECPDGTDSWDCGDCPFTNDFFCDEPNLCPPGSDADDCCASQENGVCEEIDQGGQCPDLSDYYDCGQCPWPDDGFCDEIFLCPPGSDVNDCA